jgi:excisionase family DNA binding protein
MPIKSGANQIAPPDLTHRHFASAPEAAAFLGVDIRTLRRAIQAGQIPATRVGVTWRVPTAWLMETAGKATPWTR